MSSPPTDSLLQLALSHASVAVLQADASGRMTQVNDRWCEMLGYEREELIGSSVLAITEPDSLAETRERLAALMQDGRSFVIEKNYRRKDGTRLAATSSVTAIRDESGRCTSIVAVVIDNTARARERELLARNERVLALAVEGARAGVWEYDVRTGTNRWLAGMADVLGISQAQADAQPDRWPGVVHPEDAERVAASFRRAVRARRSRWTELFRIVRPDGSVRWLDARAARVGTPDGPPRMAGIVYDVTDTRNAQLALEDADRRKDEFLATLAHELRNPLAPISNALRVMESTSDRETRDRMVAMIKRQLGQLVRLVDDLLDVARINSGKVELKLEDLDLNDIVAQALEAAAPGPLARHRVVTDLPGEPVRVHGDFVRLVQVFSNLVNNAAKYTEAPGEIRVRVSRLEGRATVSIQDTGVGLPARSLGSVFNLFTQVDQTLDRARGGLGIGLAIVKRLVEMHRGTVCVASEGLGRGCTFTVTFPTL